MSQAIASDPGLDALWGAAKLIEELTGKAMLCKPARGMSGLFMTVLMPGAKSFSFYFEDMHWEWYLSAIRFHGDDAEGLTRRLFWSGPWDGSRPLWTPESVAGLVLGTIGGWDGPAPDPDFRTV